MVEQSPHKNFFDGPAFDSADWFFLACFIRYMHNLDAVKLSENNAIYEEVAVAIFLSEPKGTCSLNKLALWHDIIQIYYATLFLH